MPLYVMRCPKCNEYKEVMVKYSDTQNIECPACHTKMEIAPSGTCFRIEGYSAENGYHRETIDYAKGSIG